VFYAGKTEHTIDRVHATQVLEPSTDCSLHLTMKKKKKNFGSLYVSFCQLIFYKNNVP